MWTGQTFAKHNHGLNPTQDAHAARIANAILRRSGDEGMAIATANKLVHRDAGGGLDPSQPTIGGLTPTTQTMNPMVQGLFQRYASLPIEKLQELNAAMGGSPQGQLVRAALRQKLFQPPPPQPQLQQPMMGMAPVAQQARGGMVKRAIGGGSPLGVPMSMASPWWERQEADRASGFLAGTTPGRADQIQTTAPGGAYIIPADVISGLGEGNSLAGARAMDEILHSGPHGTPLPRMREGSGPPRPPSDPVLLRQVEGQAKGGGVHSGQGETPVALSHGEYSVGPGEVARLGGGDLKRGHRILDRFVVEMRRRHIEKLKSLPGPVGAKLNKKST